MMNRSFLLLAGFLVCYSFSVRALPNFISQGAIDTHILTATTELKPVFPMDKSYHTAAVCFLGDPTCIAQGSFGKGDEEIMLDATQMCQDDGYKLTSCTKPAYPQQTCPHSDLYFKSCKDDFDKACLESDFVTSCNSGETLDLSQACPYSSLYAKCKCNPCEGYDYTYAQATAEGYVPNGECQSCGTTKYKRKNNPCSGFLTCDCGGEVGSANCKSGTETKYKTCKVCCANSCTLATCPTGNTCGLEACSNKYCITGCSINYEYWCTQPTTNCTTLGYTKTATQCPNGYMKCPYGSSVYCD